MQVSLIPSVSEVALNMMKKRILHKKPDGIQETPLDAYVRVATYLGNAEDASKGHGWKNTDKHFFIERATELMATGQFMPNTPTLVNAGYPRAQMSACFVLPVEDNINSIYKAVHDQGLIQNSGGGTGYYFGNVRSNGMSANSNRIITRGPLNWMKLLNENAGHVAQGTREGANMGILDISHPDIFEFINCKKAGYNIIVEEFADRYGLSVEEARRIKGVMGIEKFNISVSVTDEFMIAMESDSDWKLIDPHTKQVVKTVRARDLWENIIENAWQSGEPGIFFVDEVNRHNSIPQAGRVTATNPCGEQPLLPYESCTLGHVNLSKFVVGVNGTSSFKWKELEETIRFGLRFLDNVVEMNQFPIVELAEMNRKTRRVGLGVMGWADALAMMGVAYDSNEAIRKTEEVGNFFDEISLDESQKLGCDRGNFGYFEGSVYEKHYKYMRSNDRTTIAPTGQTSMYAGCSSGIEPVIFPVIRREQAGMIQIDYHPALFNMLEKYNLNTGEVREELASLGSVRASKLLPDHIKNAFPMALEIDPEWHVLHQTTWQKYITSAVSKTINLRNDATKADVENAYILAHKNGAKGITVYRDGSRGYQPLSAPVASKKADAVSEVSVRANPEPLVQIKRATRSPVTHGSNRKVNTGCGDLMVYVGEGKNGVEELTARLGKGGGCASAQTEAIARLASVAIRAGVPTQKIIDQLGGINCNNPGFHKSIHTPDRPKTVTSCGDAVAVALSEHVAESAGKSAEFAKVTQHSGACPECGGKIAFVEGCQKCVTCGFSKC